MPIFDKAADAQKEVTRSRLLRGEKGQEWHL